jgi:hypothetical protein
MCARCSNRLKALLGPVLIGVNTDPRLAVDSRKKVVAGTLDENIGHAKALNEAGISSMRK